MARADLLISLARAGSRGDDRLFRKTLEAIIAEERAKHHHVLADRLETVLRSNNDAGRPRPTLLDETTGNLVYERMPEIALDDLILSQIVRRACEDFVREHQRADLLRSYNVEPRNRVLLVGPPGNGKTSLAEALAQALLVPLVVVRYEGVIGTFLGETAVRLKRVFDHVRTRRCVLFFDEFDTLGKERGDVHDTGEVKRVVSSLLLQIDDLPSHVVVVAATNHSELLDRAVWRRFQVRLSLPSPTRRQIIDWFERLESRTGQCLGYAPRTLAEKLKGSSFGEIEQFGFDIQRHYVLSLPDGDMKQVVKGRLAEWQARLRVTGDHGGKR